MKYLSETTKKLGFGMMRLPMEGEEVDIPRTSAMVDAFMEAGFCYFDTATPYLDGRSEMAIRTCLVERYPRESYILTNKLSAGCFEKEADIRPFFERQLKACGVDHFDFYLMHALSAARMEKYTVTRAFEIAQELKREGKIRHVGFSFHDSAQVLDRILTEHPELEVVQLQLNYLDWEDPKVQSRECYEVCVKHGKPVIVMEPVRGGRLADVPKEAREMMTNGSPASYAIRFAAGLEQVVMVLSGMSDMAQMEDNLAAMADFRPLDEGEMAAVERAAEQIRALQRIPCTDCRYCVEGCPAGIDIPGVFRIYNARDRQAYADLAVKSDACLNCGACEAACPQHLDIRALLKKVNGRLT